MAVYTSLEYNRLRSDTGHTSTTLSDAEAEAILVQAAELYTGTMSFYAGARVIALSQLVSSASKLTSYKENNSSEDLSDVFKNLMQLLKYWQDVLDKALVDEAAASGSAAAMSLRVKVLPSW